MSLSCDLRPVTALHIGNVLDLAASGTREAASTRAEPLPTLAEVSTWALIIDDDTDNRELLSEFLELAGYLVVSCGTAADADKIMDARGKPGVVVSDVLLPDMHGPTFVGQMKRRPGFEDTPVIFVTGASPNTIGTIVDPVLTKPFDLDLLLNLVSQRCAPVDT